MAEKVTLTYQGKTYQLPLIEGSTGEQAIDITELRKTTGLITFDPGFMSTGSCKSKITYLDGEKGFYFFPGTPIEQMPKKTHFLKPPNFRKWENKTPEPQYPHNS